MLVAVTASKHKTRKVREFDIEFSSAAAQNNVDALFMLTDAIKAAFKESGLDVHPGMYLHSLKARYKFRLTVCCYDTSATTQAIRDAISQIKIIKADGIRRGKVIWPAIGPRADKPASVHAERQRRHRNKHIYNIE